MTAVPPLPEIPTVPIGDIELPRELRRLYDLAYNLWWTWNPRAQMLFATVDAVAWARYQNPVELLIGVEAAQWEALLENETFMAAYASVVSAFDRYISGQAESWFAREHAQYTAGPIAYFSMEYGVHHSLPFYAGGLGVLAGDHLKSASDLGLPLIGVGLLYRHGYFRQTVDADGFQQHTYLQHDFSRLPVRPVAGAGRSGLVVRLPFPAGEVAAKVWLVQVGRVPLLLLDTDVPDNDPGNRAITNILYVRGREMRLAQEVVLGVGGVRTLRALGIQPAVWHVNEGHSVLLQLERLREYREDGCPSLSECLQSVRADTVFTTHTPVPAGNEQFDRSLAQKYVEPFAAAMGVSASEVLALGNAHSGDHEQPFNMTALGVRTGSFANAVSRLNAQVCDRMWRHLSPDLPADQPAIQPITNGVHTTTWCGIAMRELFERHLGPHWQEGLNAGIASANIMAIPDEELWAAHQAQKERLAQFARARIREQLARHGRAPQELRALSSWVDPTALTIGFARRFAAYKRAGLLFSDLHRLRTLLGDQERPVQIFLAGKAHPADRPGQELVQHIFRLSQDPALRGRVIFLEGYDMRVAAMLVHGVDVWLNTPRRLLEASGTSGEKAALNGALNLSVLDGWWPEACDGENGWAIGQAEPYQDEDLEDRDDAQALYRLLEDQVIPLYYDRDETGIPQEWIARMKHAIVTVAPQFSGARMVRDYAERAYLPLARQEGAVGEPALTPPATRSA
jgi:starch phosphorylase